MKFLLFLTFYRAFVSILREASYPSWRAIVRRNTNRRRRVNEQKNPNNRNSRTQKLKKKEEVDVQNKKNPYSNFVL